MRHSWLVWATMAAFATGAEAQSVEALPAGVYQGAYYCLQGQTALTLTVNAPSGGRQTAEFAFGGNDGLPTGAYLVSVRAQGSDVVFTPDRWLRKPENYEMVGSHLRREGDRLTGVITNPNCRWIMVRRREGTVTVLDPE
jgi:hypothetical protein